MSDVNVQVCPAVAGWMFSRHFLGRVFTVCFLLVSAVSTATTPPALETRGACGWREGFTQADLDGPALASAMFDDGTGPALYVAGGFRNANGIPVNGIARWDGNAWSPLSGPSGIGTTGSVHALAVFDDGSGPALYAGGDFLVAGGVAVNFVARWDGTAWSALEGPAGTGMNDAVDALAVFDDGSGAALFAGGAFSSAGGVWVRFVARWNGSAWSPLAGPSGTGVDSGVRALAVFDDGSGPALYVGGFFSNAGGLPAGRIARWNGTAWSGLSGTPGQGFNEGVRALVVFDQGSGPALYAGGMFTSVSSQTVNHVARWDGTAWSPLIGPSGTGTTGQAFTLAVFDDGEGPALYVGGDFSTAGGVDVNHVARWDGGAWSSLTGPLGTGTGGSVRALSVFDHDSGQALVVAGDFDAAGGVRTNSIAAWNGSAWSAFNTAPGMGLSDAVRALASFDDGFGPALYAGGDFGDAGGIPVRHVARWDGTDWSALEGPSAAGTSDDVDALAVFDDGSGPALYAGGSFVAAGGVTVNHLARWDGAAWTPLATTSGTGTDDNVYSLAVFDDGSGPALYAGGSFVTAGGAAVNHVVRWNGAAWATLSGPSGTGTDGAVYALAVVDDGSGPALYAGGSFATAGGVTVNGVARWDGSSWSALSGPAGTGVGGISPTVFALAGFDDGSGPALYAGGSFEGAGGVTASYLARWNGTEWSAVNPNGPDPINHVYALATADDGSGPAFYAGGAFTGCGNTRVNQIARWDGSAWSPLSGPSGIGLSSTVWAIAPFDAGSGPSIFVGGHFTSAGGLASSHLAAWRCPSAVFTDGFEGASTSAWSLTIP